MRAALAGGRRELKQKSARKETLRGMRSGNAEDGETTPRTERLRSFVHPRRMPSGRHAFWYFLGFGAAWELVGDAELGKDEGVVEGDLAEIVVAAAGATVACAHVGFEEEGVGVGLESAKLGDVLGGLPVHDLTVVETGLDEHRGIVFAFETCIRAIRFHIKIILGALGVAPFFVFADSERKGGIEHGVEHVHEGDMGDDDAEKIGAKIGDRAHKEAAGTAALDDEFAVRGEAPSDEILGAGDEIGERVHFSVHAASIMPGLAEFAAAANVSDGEDDAAIEEAEPVGTEGHGHRKAVAAVAVEEKRGGGVAGGVVAIDDG